MPPGAPALKIRLAARPSRLGVSPLPWLARGARCAARAVAAAFALAAAAAASPPPNPCPPPRSEASAASAAGEFDGVYRVGRTRCTVRPGKMAYTLRWQRGHRDMDYFYDGESAAGEPVFVSQPRADGVDRFYFADRGLRDGVFVRADGLCLPVRRIGDAPAR